MAEKPALPQIIFKRNVAESSHYPITVANGLDAILSSGGYKRLEMPKGSEQFIWESPTKERVTVDYYTNINSLAYSYPLLPAEMEKQAPEVLEKGYRNLQDLFAKLVQQLGFPYLSVERQLLFGVEGDTAPEKLQELIPYVRKLLEQEERVRVDVNMLETTPKSALALLTPFGADE